MLKEQHITHCVVIYLLFYLREMLKQASQSSFHSRLNSCEAHGQLSSETPAEFQWRWSQDFGSLFFWFVALLGIFVLLHDLVSPK